MTRILSHEEVLAYLEWVRKGEGLNKAARLIRVDPKAVRDARQANPEFNEMVEMAEAEAAEPVEGKLYQSAIAGEPWAVRMWLERRSKDRWGAPPTTVNVNHGIAPGVSRIVELTQLLEQRRQMLGISAGPVLDVEAEPEC